MVFRRPCRPAERLGAAKGCGTQYSRGLAGLRTEVRGARDLTRISGTTALLAYLLRQPGRLRFISLFGTKLGFRSMSKALGWGCQALCFINENASMERDLTRRATLLRAESGSVDALLGVGSASAP